MEKKDEREESTAMAMTTLVRLTEVTSLCVGSTSGSSAEQQNIINLRSYGYVSIYYLYYITFSYTIDSRKENGGGREGEESFIIIGSIQSNKYDKLKTETNDKFPTEEMIYGGGEGDGGGGGGEGETGEEKGEKEERRGRKRKKRRRRGRRSRRRS